MEMAGTSPGPAAAASRSNNSARARGCHCCSNVGHSPQRLPRRGRGLLLGRARRHEPRLPRRCRSRTRHHIQHIQGRSSCPCCS